MSEPRPADAVVAGHVCLDLTPRIDAAPPPGAGLVRPGTLTAVGPVATSTGGAVSNTGLALHRLGVKTRLIARVGDDLLGGEVLRILRSVDPALADGVRVVPGETTSYSIVVAPPGVDRAFLHCPGANDGFTSHDIDYDSLVGAKLLHFGYPPIMRRMYEDNGREIVRMFGQAKLRGLTTSLDLCGIDPSSPAGREDWRAILQSAAAETDIFTPSLDELLVALRRPAIDPSRPPPIELLRELSRSFIGVGCSIVLLKLGEHGLYAATSTKCSARGGGALADRRDWVDREILVPAFDVGVVNTNGAGDCAIAGFLGAVLRNESLEEAVIAAAATGASACESADANTVPHWSTIRSRIDAGWAKRV